MSRPWKSTSCTVVAAGTSSKTFVGVTKVISDNWHGVRVLNCWRFWPLWPEEDRTFYDACYREGRQVLNLAGTHKVHFLNHQILATLYLQHRCWRALALGICIFTVLITSRGQFFFKTIDVVQQCLLCYKTPTKLTSYMNSKPRRLNRSRADLQFTEIRSTKFIKFELLPHSHQYWRIILERTKEIGKFSLCVFSRIWQS